MRAIATGWRRHDNPPESFQNFSIGGTVESDYRGAEASGEVLSFEDLGDRSNEIDARLLLWKTNLTFV